jgi:hypothetical protein
VEECTGRSQSEPSDLGWKNPTAVGSARSYPRVKTPVYRGENPGTDLSRPIDKGHVS